MQKRRQAERKQVTQDEQAKTKPADLEKTDELLAEIDALLAEEEKEISFKEKIRSLSFRGRRARNPCAGVMHVPDPLVPFFRAIGARDAPPDCVDCE